MNDGHRVQRPRGSFLSTQPRCARNRPTGFVFVRGCNAPGRWVDHHHDGGFMRITGCLAAVLAATTLATAVADAQNGNGAPNGTHYSLNIIGVPREKNSNPDWASGHVIFVNLGSKNVTVTTKILLSQSTASGVFDVLDKNGTDGEASFSLPRPRYLHRLGTRARDPWRTSEDHHLRDRHLPHHPGRDLLDAQRGLRPRDGRQQVPQRDRRPHDDHA